MGLPTVALAALNRVRVYSHALTPPATQLRARVPMPVAFSELLDAFEFISADPMFGNSARVNRETGTVHWHSDFESGLYELPEDIEDDQKYLELPGPRDLDLGRPLVMRFAADELDDHYDEIADIFSRRGAYRRFKDFLIRVGALDPLVRLRERGEGKSVAVNGARTTGSRSTGRPCPFRGRGMD